MSCAPLRNYLRRERTGTPMRAFLRTIILLALLVLLLVAFHQPLITAGARFLIVQDSLEKGDDGDSPRRGRDGGPPHPRTPPPASAGARDPRGGAALRAGIDQHRRAGPQPATDSGGPRGAPRPPRGWGTREQATESVILEYIKLALALVR